MAEKALLYNRYKNEWYELAYNETAALLDRDEEIYLSLPKELNNWKLRIIFLSNNYTFGSSISTEFPPNNEIVIKLTNWYSETGVQNTEPLVLQSKDGKLVTLTVLKSVANRTQNSRSLTISIWKKTNP